MSEKARLELLLLPHAPSTKRVFFFFFFFFFSFFVDQQKPRTKVSVQQLCKKIGESIKRAQELAVVASENEEFERVLVSLSKTSKTLRDGVKKLPGETGVLVSNGEKLLGEVSSFSEAARAFHRNTSSATLKSNMDRTAFDVYSLVSCIKRDATAIAKSKKDGEDLLMSPRADDEANSASNIAADSLRALDKVVQARDGAKYKDVEKETALHLSVIIRQLKAQAGGKQAADEMFQQTQALVATGRAAVTDSSKYVEFKQVCEKLLHVLGADAVISPRPQPPSQSPIVSDNSSNNNNNAAAAAAAPTASKPPPPVVSPRNPPVESPRNPAGKMVESSAVGAENSKVQFVTARKTTAAQDLLRNMGIDPSNPSKAPPAPIPPPADNPSAQKKAIKEQKKKEKLEKMAAKKVEEKKEKRSLFRRKKEKVRRASVVLSNEEKAQLARMKAEQINETKKSDDSAEIENARAIAAQAKAEREEIERKLQLEAEQRRQEEEAERLATLQKHRDAEAKRKADEEAASAAAMLRKKEEEERLQQQKRAEAIRRAEEEAAAAAAAKAESERRKQLEEAAKPKVKTVEEEEQERLLMEIEASKRMFEDEANQFLLQEQARQADLSLREKQLEELERAKELELEEEIRREQQRRQQEEEQLRRQVALEQERLEQERRENEEKRRRLEEEKRAAEREAEERRRRQEEERRKEEEQRRQREEDERRREEQLRLQKEEEDRRKRAEAEAEQRRKLEAEEADRLRKKQEQEAADRARKLQEEEDQRKRAAEQEEVARKQEQDRMRELEAEQRRIEAEMKEKQERLKAAKEERMRREEQERLKKEEEQRLAAAELEKKQRMEKLMREREELQRIREAEKAELARKEAELKRIEAEKEAQRKAEQERIRMAAEELQREEEEKVRQEAEKARLQAEAEKKRLEEEAKQRAAEEARRLEEEIRLKNAAAEALHKEQMLAAERELEEKRRREEEEIEAKKKAWQEQERQRIMEEEARLKEKESQLKAEREERLKREQEEKQRLELEAERLKALEMQRLAAVQRTKLDEDARREKRSQSRAANVKMEALPKLESSLPRISRGIVAVKAKPGFVLVRLCEDCGEEAGVDPYCDQCGGNVVEVEIEAKAAAKTAAKASDDEDDDDDDDSDLALRVCMDCGEEGGAEKCCKHCGGDMIALDANDLDESLLSPMGTVTLDQAVEKAEKGVGKALFKGDGEVKIAAPFPGSDLKARDYDASEDDVFIVEIGSDSIKYGWSSDASPARVTTTIVNETLKVPKPLFDAKNKDFFADNDDLADLIKFVFKMGGYKKNHPVLVCSSAPISCDGNSDLLDAIIEPRFSSKVPKFVSFASSPVLSACSAKGSLTPTGLVVDIGFYVTSIVPVYFGSVLSYAAVQVPQGALNLLQFFASVTGQSAVFKVPAKLASVKNAFGAGCSVAKDFVTEMKDKGYSPVAVDPQQPIAGWKCTAPSRDVKKEISGISVGIASIAVPELLFQPALFTGSTEQLQPLPKLIAQVLENVSADLKKDMMENIILAGQTCRIPGMQERVLAELAKLGLAEANVKVAKDFSSWLGAKDLATNQHFKRYCVTAEEAELMHFRYRFL